MSNRLPPDLGPFNRYGTTVRRLKKKAREALAVGDAELARRCYGAIDSMRQDRGMKPRRR